MARRLRRLKVPDQPGMGVDRGVKEMGRLGFAPAAREQAKKYGVWRALALQGA
jgi:hypothetical protein